MQATYIADYKSPLLVGGLSSNASVVAVPAARTNPVTGKLSYETIIPVRGRNVEVSFIGTDAANEAFNYMILRWKAASAIARAGVKATAPGAQPIPLYLAGMLFTGVATLGTRTGTASTDLVNTTLIADTITVASNSDLVTDKYDLYSPADNTIATLLFDAVGADYVSVITDIDSSTAATAGALIASWG